MRVNGLDGQRTDSGRNNVRRKKGERKRGGDEERYHRGDQETGVDGQRVCCMRK